MNKNWIKSEINIEIETKLVICHTSSGIVFLQGVERVCNQKSVIKFFEISYKDCQKCFQY